jgi:5'-3' exoribonuclease 1
VCPTFILGSHPNDEDARFRMLEEQILTAIFSYVDTLFGKIKSKKLVFMAADGVAPRAKMNQQLTVSHCQGSEGNQGEGRVEGRKATRRDSMR